MARDDIGALHPGPRQASTDSTGYCNGAANRVSCFVVRAVWLALVIGCGGGAAPEDAKPIARLDLPQLDESARVTVLTKAKPAAVVWVSGNGGAVVREGGAWKGELGAPREPEPENIRAALIEAVLRAKSPLVDDADRWRKESERVKAAPKLRLPSTQVVALGKIDRLAPLVIATPSAPASKLVRVLMSTGGVLAVDHLGQLAALDLAFDQQRDPAPEPSLWLEVWIDASGLHLTTQPGDKDTVVPYAGMAIDRGALQIAWRKLDLGKAPVDVLVRSDTTVQSLVDVLASLSTIGIDAPAIAVGPDSMTARAEQIKTAQGGGMFGQPSAIAGMPNVQGDLDKPTIRFTVQQKLPEIRACYEKRLVDDPRLGGTVITQFFISPDGKVASASASGVDREVASCVASVLRSIQFPKPTSGGGVQVSYPFTFLLGGPP